MKKLLICLTILFSVFLFTNSVSAATITGKSGRVFSNVSSERVVIYDYNGINSSTTSGVRYGIIPASVNYLYAIGSGAGKDSWVYNTSIFSDTNDRNSVNFSRYKANSLSSWSTMSSANYLATDANGNFNNVIEYSYYDIWSSDWSEILYCGDVESECVVEPSSYNFDETINSLNYSKVEFVFDIPDMETTFNFNYDFYSSDNSTTFKSPYFEETYTSCSTDENGVSSCRPFPLINNFLIEEGTEENGQCHLDEFGLPNCYKPNDYSNDDEINVSNSYVVSNYDMVLNNDILTKVTSSLKLVLDLEFNSNVIVDVSFTSSLPFDVVYHERTTVSNHYETVDLTGKYGAVFIPKFDITDEALNIRTLFKGTGNLDVQHRSSLDIVNYKILSAYSLNYCNDFLFNQDLIPYSCNEFNGEFEFYVSNSNLEQALFFVNGHYSDDELTEVNVMYDTRYYEYWVFDTPTSIVPITNPNTGDNSYISLEEFYNFAEVDTGFLTDLVNKILDFFFEKFPVVKQFKMIISLFTYNEDFDDAPVFTVSLDSIGIDKEVQIIDFSIFDQYRSTVIFWEMLFITTLTIVKVTENVGKAFKGD